MTPNIDTPIDTPSDAPAAPPPSFSLHGPQIDEAGAGDAQLGQEYTITLRAKCSSASDPSDATSGGEKTFSFDITGIDSLVPSTGGVPPTGEPTDEAGAIPPAEGKDDSDESGEGAIPPAEPAGEESESDPAEEKMLGYKRPKAKKAAPKKSVAKDLADY